MLSRALRLCKTITYLFNIPSKTHLRRREGIEKHLHRTTDVVVPAWKPGSRSQEVKVSLSCALDPGFLPGRRSVDYARIFLPPPVCKSESHLGAKKIGYCFTEPYSSIPETLSVSGIYKHTYKKR